MAAASSLSLLVGLVLLASARSQLEFQTNAGEGNYLFEYNETYIGENNELIYGLPPGHFSVICLLGSLPVIEFGVSYTFSGGDGSDVFTVNITTGALSLAAGAILDYETEDRYIFNVRCTAGVSGTETPLTRTAQVTFSVLPVNEFLPVLTSRNTFVSITESTPIGTVIASTSLASGARVIYSVTDMDRGDNIIYTLDGANLTSFSVDSSGTVTVVQALDTDFGVVGTVVEAIRLIACDVSPPNPQCPNIAIRIIIRGINDNDPVFSQDLYAVTVAESTAFGTLIARVICTDADVGAGEFLSVNSSSNLFNVTSNEAGQDVYLGGQLDYETARSHTATLLCFDTGGKIANATFNLAVEPVNDNPPRFTESSYFFTMNRIFTTGNEVGRVEAIDLDEGIGNQLEYNLTGDDNFRIQNDGSIILRDFVYVVEGQLLDLQVTVSDGQNRDTASVQIRVNGVLSIPEIILVSMGVIIFAFLALFVIVFCCYCCVCCSRLIPKQRHVDVPVEVLPNNGIMMDPMNMMMAGDMYNQGKGPMYMIGQIPSHEDQWEGDSGEESEEMPADLGSFVTASSNVYTPSPQLKEMIDKFEEGDEILRGKKPKKKT